MKQISIELFFPLELKDKPIICNMIKKFDVVVIIREASFSTSTGWAYLTLKSDSEAELEKVYTYLRRQGVRLVKREF